MPDDLRKRTKQFALRVIRYTAKLPNSVEADVLGRQLLKAGTSPGAHYREACRSRSDAELICKVVVALQELDESQYWTELLVESGIGAVDSGQEIWQEADELIAIFVTSVKNTKSRRGLQLK
jgi:four helix bundle protein